MSLDISNDKNKSLKQDTIFITSFGSITMFSRTDNIPQNIVSPIEHC